MKVNNYTGDLFKNIPLGGAFAHGCNLRGVMGAGVAKIVREKFPNTYETYRGYCRAGFIASGHSLVLKENGVWIFNLITQVEPGPNAYINLIREAFTAAAYQAERLELGSINMPQIGCGIGGLTWPAVSATLEAIESDVELNVYTLGE